MSHCPDCYIGGDGAWECGHEAKIAALEAHLAEVTAERDGIKARSLSVIKARDHDLLIMRDEFSVAVGRVGVLEDALKQCAEALHNARGAILRVIADEDGLDGQDGATVLVGVDVALALPVVQAVLKAT